MTTNQKTKRIEKILDMLQNVMCTEVLNLSDEGYEEMVKIESELEYLLR